MGLLRVQQELAAILMEPGVRKAFATDPRGLLRQRGVTGNDLRLLACLVPDDLAYFAERRNIDRLQALRADAPRSTRLLEKAHGRLNAYFRAHPYSLEDPRLETDRFARWCRAAARSGSVSAVLPDLAAFDAAVLRLLGRAGRLPAIRSAKPRRAPGVRVLRLQHALGPALRSGDTADARPGRAAMALRRTSDDVLWFGLSPLDAELLHRATGRVTVASWQRAAASATGSTLPQVRRAVRGLVADGLVAPF